MIKEQGRFVTSVEMRDQFGWKLRQTARVLMRLLEAEGKVVILPNPARKKSYVYGLSGMPKPTVETPKPKEKSQKEKKPKPKPADEKLKPTNKVEGGEVHKEMDATLKNIEKAGKALTNKDTKPRNSWK